jgi:hypothetical protein
MDGAFGASFAENFQDLAKLLCENECTAAPATAGVSRATHAGPAGVGPPGIIPGVKVADPNGTSTECRLYFASNLFSPSSQ